MHDIKTPKIEHDLLLAGVCTILVYLTTSIHHIYGGIIYNTPWRSHVAIQALLPLLICLGLLHAYKKNEHRLFVWAFAVISGTIFIGAIGLWEGGWNHVAKILFFATGLSDYFSYAPTFVLPPNV